MPMSSADQGAAQGEAGQNQVHGEQSSGFLDWAESAQREVAADPRSRPWKQTFGDSVDHGFSKQADWAPVRGESDVQHNG